MENKKIVVQRIDGDYALLEDEDGNSAPVARALLPEAIEEGSVLIQAGFEYTLLL